MSLQRQCPLTRGQYTAMTAAAFACCCAAAKREARTYTDEARFVTSRGNLVVFNPTCLSCTEPPAELTIIEIPPPIFTKEKAMTKQTDKPTIAPANEAAPAGEIDRLQRQVNKLVEALRYDYCASAEEITALLKV
jgi:hypothetical protein